MTTASGPRRARASELAPVEALDRDGQFVSTAAWASRADRDGSLVGFLTPDLSPAERAVAQVEGWILGVPGLIREPIRD
jgi:hypothetical protein